MKMESRRRCCCSYSSSSLSSFRSTRLIKPDPFCELRYPPPEKMMSISPLACNMVSNSPGLSYSRFGNDERYSAFPEIGWDQGGFHGKEIKSPFMIRWKSGEKVDERLMMVLESYYQEIYVKRQEFFNKIFPGIHHEFSDVLLKIDAMLWKNNDEVKNNQTSHLQRSLSVESPRRRPQRFKMKTPAVIIGNIASQGGDKHCQPATRGGK